jgi:hypothetical protein
MQRITYNNNIVVYNQPDRVNSFCAEITFYNQGNTILILNNGLQLLPTMSAEFDGKQGEEDTSVYIINFDSSNVVSPAVPFNQCVVLRKYYNA